MRCIDTPRMVSVECTVLCGRAQTLTLFKLNLTFRFDRDWIQHYYRSESTMCSVLDPEDANQCMEPKPILMRGTQCQKCSAQAAAVQILQVKHAYCRECFLTHVNHKFRSTLGKSKMMRPSDNILVAFSGSEKSLAMLHMLNTGFTEKSPKRFLFSVKVLFIDEGSLLCLTREQRSSNLQRIAQLASTFGFAVFATTLDHSIQPPSGPLCFPVNNCYELYKEVDGGTKLKNLMNGITSLTAKEDLLHQLRKKLLIDAAKELGCEKIFVGDTGTDLAVQILTNVSLGRGSQLHDDVAFCDKRDLDVKIIRPMRELSRKEVAYYSIFHKLERIPIPSLGTKTSNDASIQNLAEHFIMELMEGFPSTATTVFRTGEKLGSANVSHSSREEEDSLCALCQAHLVTEAADCSSLKATQLSRLVSTLGPTGFDNKSLKPFPSSSIESDSSMKVCNGVGASFEKKSDCSTQNTGKEQTTHPSHAEISACLCYSCNLILTDLETPQNLPKRVLQSVMQRTRVRELRGSIEDFLL